MERPRETETEKDGQQRKKKVNGAREVRQEKPGRQEVETRKNET